MAFDIASLKALSHANGFTLWFYRSEDAVVTTPGYLDQAAHLLDRSDVLIVELPGEGADCVVLHSVIESAGGKVKLSEATNISRL